MPISGLSTTNSRYSVYLSLSVPRAEAWISPAPRPFVLGRKRDRTIGPKGRRRFLLAKTMWEQITQFANRRSGRISAVPFHLVYWFPHNNSPFCFLLNTIAELIRF
ncbi:MAG: hypothetical protein UV64_C0010G0003 [Parcubacteria group bacterium GW2011_GWC1_43_11b]|nr:MAG: hypothetical protein UV50_C0007G0005 [Parcubacteria group bacterium GW2011_GWB1_42_9]KKS89162.1 MAG: hypothetical protein UV64_C0010G0003 [Parcubacteria group bacterium GW2011_GWC1_43_11b]KKT08640.1 MAG: hypothetical protein UV88_C0019G0003 [Parcubacteria group bacterium GW2011_GWA1_43_21]